MDPSEVDEIFDTISYSKGASVINMLHVFLGDEAFRAGLREYLAKYQYANAETEDLWQSLSASAGLDVGALMRPWTQTMGFPVLTVEPLEVKDKSIGVRLSQVQYKLTAATGLYLPLLCNRGLLHFTQLTSGFDDSGF